MSDCLQPRGWQHVRLLCPSLSPRVCSNSDTLNRWCHPTISSPATRFSSCHQSFPASGSFPVSQLFESSGQSVLASASVLPMNIQSWLPLELTGLISLLSKGLRVFSSTTIWKHQFFTRQWIINKEFRKENTYFHSSLPPTRTYASKGSSDAGTTQQAWSGLLWELETQGLGPESMSPSSCSNSAM